MNCHIFIVTYRKHFDYLAYALRSINKCCSGFAGLSILVPDEDIEELFRIVLHNPCTTQATCLCGTEWPDKGMLWHEAQICRSDEWLPEADCIVHIDSDCIFTDKVTPATFITNELKPVLQFQAFDSIGLQHPEVLKWRAVAEACLPFECPYETMRQHGETHLRKTYKRTRELVEQKTGKKFDDYVRSCENSFPQTFCEFVTLGNVAMHEFPDEYTLVDWAQNQNKHKAVFPIQQFWGHGAIDQPQEIWVQGEIQRIIPLNLMQHYGLA